MVMRCEIGSADIFLGWYGASLVVGHHRKETLRIQTVRQCGSHHRVVVDASKIEDNRVALLPPCGVVYARCIQA